MQNVAIFYYQRLDLHPDEAHVSKVGRLPAILNLISMHRVRTSLVLRESHPLARGVCLILLFALVAVKTRLDLNRIKVIHSLSFAVLEVLWLLLFCLIL